METVRVYRTRVRGWEGSFAYCRMRGHEQKPLGTNAPYRKHLEEYAKKYVALQQALGPEYLNDRQALIVGPGVDPAEASLLFTVFPNLARLHLLDWHEPNIDQLHKTLTQWAEQKPQYGRVKLHLSDAVNMDDVSASTLHLVQVNNVLQFVEGVDGSLPKALPLKVLDILREVKRVLVLEGYLFMLDTEESRPLSAALISFGFIKVQDHLWKRLA